MLNNFEKRIHKDNRGEHIKFFVKDEAILDGFKEVHEVFTTINHKGTLRGLHFQSNPDQQKIIKALNGLFNVRVVLKENEDYEANYTYKENINGYTVYYFDNVGLHDKPIFAPKGALLGYVSLEDNSIMLYVADENFDSKGDNGVHPFTEKLNINWNYDGEFIMSKRDKELSKSL